MLLQGYADAGDLRVEESRLKPFVRRVYTLSIRLAVPVAFAALLFRGLRDRAYWDGWGERLGYGPRVPGPPCLWLHAVSLGEVAAAAPIVRALRARDPLTADRRDDGDADRSFARARLVRR